MAKTMLSLFNLRSEITNKHLLKNKHEQMINKVKKVMPNLLRLKIRVSR